MTEIVAEITHLARRSNDISQRSGVSVRVSICNYESMLANALRRSIRNREGQVAPRVTDLSALLATTGGKIELESVGETTEEKIVERLVQRATLNVFNRHFQIADLDELVVNFDRGLSIETSDSMSSLEYMTQAGEVGGLTEAVRKLGAQGNPALVASAMEFILEGLHLHRKLNKDRVAGQRGRFHFGAGR
jgi:magnesium chelatase subunit I